MAEAKTGWERLGFNPFPEDPAEVESEALGDQVPPLSVDERSRFVTVRFCEYRDALFRIAGVAHPEPYQEQEKRMIIRLRELADRLAFEDLQAVLGRRGRAGLRTELLRPRRERPSP